MISVGRQNERDSQIHGKNPDTELATRSTGFSREVVDEIAKLYVNSDKANEKH